MLLCKNANFLKVPEESSDLIILLKLIEELEIKYKGASISGKIITDTIGLVNFSSSNKQIGEKFSLCADLRIVWGPSCRSGNRKFKKQRSCRNIGIWPKILFRHV